MEQRNLGEVFRSSGGNKAAIGIFGVNVATSYRWMKSVKGAAEQQIWVAEGVANGFRPWFTKFGGVQEDERWMPQVRKFYEWHKSAERYLRDRKPAARVAMVYSQQSSLYYGGQQAQATVGDAVNGMYHALIEARIPFEMVHDRKLEELARFKIAVLPNVAALSDAQCEQLRKFVAGGGSLVATYSTSLFDEWGEPRKDFGLGDVLGVRYKGKILGPLRNSYLAFRGKPGEKRHPILAGLEDAAYTVNTIRSVDTEATTAMADAPITLIPSYPDLPMEYVYERTPRGNTPQVFLRDLGQARTVYFPYGPGPHLLGRDAGGPRPAAGECRAVGDERGAGGDGEWSGAAGCGAVAAERGHRGAPGELHESDDDERSDAGADSGRRAAGADEAGGGGEGREGAAAGEREGGGGEGGGRVCRGDGALGVGS